MINYQRHIDEITKIYSRENELTLDEATELLLTIDCICTRHEEGKKLNPVERNERRKHIKEYLEYEKSRWTNLISTTETKYSTIVD